MAKIIRELAVRLGMQVDFGKLARVNQQLNRVGRNALAMGAGIGSAIGTLAGSLILPALEGLTRMAVEASVAGGAINDLSEAIGVGVVATQELSYAFQDAGATSRQAQQLMTRLQRRALQLADGNKSAAEAFGRLGISTRNVVNESGGLADLDTLLDRVADGLAGLGSEQERVAAASLLLGNRARDASTALFKGSAAFRRTRADAHRFGLVLDAEAVAASDRFSDSLQRLQMAQRTFRAELGAEFAPLLTDIADGVRDWLGANRQVIRQNLRGYVSRLRGAVRRFGESLRQVDAIVRERVGGWGNVLQAGLGALTSLLGARLLLPMIPTIVSAAKAFGGLGAAIGGIIGVGSGIVGTFTGIALAVGSVVGGIALLIGGFLALDEAISFGKGEKTALQEFTDWLREVGGPTGKAAARFIEALATQISIQFRAIDQTIRAVVNGTSALIRRLFREIGKTARETERLINTLLRLGNSIGLTPASIAAIIDQGTAALERSNAGGRTTVEEIGRVRRANLLRASIAAQSGAGAGFDGPGFSTAGRQALRDDPVAHTFIINGAQGQSETDIARAVAERFAAQVRQADASRGL